MKMQSYKKSPLNYTGNKYRILKQIFPHFPNKINIMVDLFCGGATVGLNIDCNVVYFVDNNPFVIGLLEFLSKSDFVELLKAMEEKIDYYGLSYSNLNGYSIYFNKKTPTNKNNGLKDYNKLGFEEMRKDYNNLKNKKTKEANLLLYLLLVYGFNNDLRFNNKNEYNLPCGKTDLNKFNIMKVYDFINESKKKEFHFICGDYESKKVQEIIKIADFVYLDPPYLITDAFYNESNKWNQLEETRLLNFLSKLIIEKKCFVLSNVLVNGERTNVFLQNWIKENENLVNVYPINYHYRSASYNKKNRNAIEKEVIVCYEK